MRLTRTQKDALRLIARSDEREGYVTCEALFDDTEVGLVGVHWRTAQALIGKGLAVVTDDNLDEGYCIGLTPLGVSLASRGDA